MVKLSGFGNFQLRDKAAAARPQSEDRGGDPHHRAARGDLPREPEAEGLVEKSFNGDGEPAYD